MTTTRTLSAIKLSFSLPLFRSFDLYLLEEEGEKWNAGKEGGKEREAKEKRIAQLGFFPFELVSLGRQFLGDSPRPSLFLVDSLARSGLLLFVICISFILVQTRLVSPDKRTQPHYTLKHYTKRTVISDSLSKITCSRSTELCQW